MLRGARGFPTSVQFLRAVHWDRCAVRSTQRWAAAFVDFYAVQGAWVIVWRVLCRGELVSGVVVIHGSAGAVGDQGVLLWNVPSCLLCENW